MGLKNNKDMQLKLIEDDPWLKSYEKAIEGRLQDYILLKNRLLEKIGSLSEFANGYNFYGFHIEDDYFVYREWAPNALQLFLVGDFNDWNSVRHPLTKKGGFWELKIPYSEYKNKLINGSKVKVIVYTRDKKKEYKIPTYIRRVIQEDNKEYVGQIWFDNYKWNDSNFFKKPQKKENVFIYETHIGMAQEKAGIGTYKEFKEKILPKIKKQGYNTIQIMGIMEHPYYGSFGYQVSNFFACSSRFGTPLELKELIDSAHQLGITVLLDIVHSHAVKNTREGLNKFDGTDYQFFLEEDHPAWGTKLFNYKSHDVLHFLLSNLKYWIEEFHFDGFRFDGVTSMLYKNYGLGINFDNYSKYYNENTNLDALNYLKLANELIKEINPFSLSICEDMSGMPGMCYPINEGGVGFDYRLNMGLPDFFEKLPEIKDEDISMDMIYNQLKNRRSNEKNIGYVESHDQALVGGKTNIFRLADKQMYYHMRKNDKNIKIDRAIALHKIYRFLTVILGGEGYLNFMGNEFGHPEWIDFPREGNNWSYKYAQRKWSLSEDKNLKYYYLNQFDKDLIHFVKENIILRNKAKKLFIHNEKKILVFEKDKFIFCLNLHPNMSYVDIEVENVKNGKYNLVLNTDNSKYLGFDLLERDYVFDVKNNKIKLYIPSRSMFALEKK